MNVLGDVALDEDVTWGQDSDAFGGPGVRTSKPEEMGLLADDNRAIPRVSGAGSFHGSRPLFIGIEKFCVRH